MNSTPPHGMPLLLPTRCALLACAAALLALGACNRPAADEAAAAEAAGPPATPVEAVEVQPGTFEDVIELTGQVESPSDATLSPDVPGTLTFVAAVGTAVRAGQAVAQVNPAQAQAGVQGAQAQIASAEAGVAQARAGIQAAEAQRRAAQAQLDLAQDQFRRQQPLLRDSILSPLEFRGVEANLAGARAQVAQADAGVAQARGQLAAAEGQRGAALAGLRQAQTSLGSTRIVAPFSGVVEQRLMQAGELASPGMPVVRLVAGGQVRVTAGVPERYAGEIGTGAPVRIVPSAYGAETRGGRVAFSGLAVDPQSRTFPVEIAVDNSDGALKPAMIVRLELTRALLENVLTVPQEAVLRDERGTSVFVAVPGPDGQTVAARRPVELGPTAGGRVVLASGVSAGDRVVTSGQTNLAEGDPVRIAPARSAARTPEARPAPAAQPASARLP